MKLQLSQAEFPVIDATDQVLDTVRKALVAEGYAWEPTGPKSALAGKGTSDPHGRQPAGSAKTQIEVRVEEAMLKTRRLSRGNHKGFVGVVQVQQDHRRAAKVIRQALTRARLLR